MRVLVETLYRIILQHVLKQPKVIESDIIYHAFVSTYLLSALELQMI